MKLSVIGIGPGNEKYLTREARDALDCSDMIIGYPLYLELIKPLIEGKEWFSTPMRKEIERCRAALGKAAEGRNVALVCSGDAGVYGMASLVYELAPEYPLVEICVIPGITAALSGAALLGSPLAGDFAVISLSDLLTPPETVEARLAAAAKGGFPICLYNPASKNRRGNLAKACDIILQFRGAGTVCGVVQNAGRKGERVFLTDLKTLRDYEADMITTLFIGNPETFRAGGKMVTPRGYPGLSGREARAKNPASPPRRSPADDSPADDSGGEIPGLPAGKPALRLFVFAGATEGRLFIEKFKKTAKAPFYMFVFTATEYGASLLREGPALSSGDGAEILLHSGRLDADAMYREMCRHKPSCAIDCTHPHAAEASRNIRAACGRAGCEYLRIARESSSYAAAPAGGTAVDSLEEAAGFLRRREGNILLATGSKGLEFFGTEELRNRAFPRILPMEESIRKCRALGFPAKNILCMQGPFSEDFNRSLLREIGASWMVTKDSGDEGGFLDKIRAAEREGVQVVLLRRPADESPEGKRVSIEDAVSRLLKDSPV
ncbi:MAG: precorrin-3B C(17)-methyltransferase [Treponema sp.]|jgi:precorrin-3B C17-methyltransferase|nr:precorrin-3B C(17)-methyltransferase [Treponema sp.]